jgi:hypothetical protein
MIMLFSLPWAAVRHSAYAPMPEETIGLVNQRALDHVPRFVNDQAEAPAPRKARQPVAADVRFRL